MKRLPGILVDIAVLAVLASLPAMILVWSLS